MDFDDDDTPYVEDIATTTNAAAATTTTTTTTTTTATSVNNDNVDSETSEEDEDGIMNPEDPEEMGSYVPPPQHVQYVKQYKFIEGFQVLEKGRDFLKMFAYYKNKYCEMFDGESSALSKAIKDIAGIKQFFLNPEKTTRKEDHCHTKRLKGLVLDGDPTCELTANDVNEDEYNFIINCLHYSKHDLSPGKTTINGNGDEIYRIEIIKSVSYDDKKFTKKILSSFDLFGGIGGNALGLDKAGIRAKLCVEWCKYATATYESVNCECSTVLNRDAMDILKEMQTAKEAGKNEVTVIKQHQVYLASLDEKLREHTDEFLIQGDEKVTFKMDSFDVLHSSPPCKEYSGGNAINQARLQHNQQENSSSSDNRSEAQKHYFKTVPGYVKCLSPPFVVVENVAGVSSRVNSDAATFGDLGVVQQLLQRLFDMNYQIMAMQMNAADYGAPQNRKRYIVIAAKFGYTLPQCPIKTTMGSNRISCEDALSDLRRIRGTNEDKNKCDGGSKDLWKKYRIDFNNLQSNFQKEMRSDHVYEYREQTDGNYTKDTRSKDQKSKIPIVANHYTYNRIIKGPANDHSQIQLTRYNCSNCCYGGTKMRHYDTNHQKRLLTVREHMRLQCLPDYVVVFGKLDRQFKSVNNCVPVALATAIGKSIITAAGAVTDATNINQKLVILEGETDEDDVVDNEDEWMINDIFTHENMLVKDPQKQTVRDETRENGEKCYCPDCEILSNAQKGAGISYEVFWSEYWANHDPGYGRSKRTNEGTPYWSADFDVGLNEHVYRYAEKKMGRRNKDIKKETSTSRNENSSGANNDQNMMMMMPTTTTTTTTTTTSTNPRPHPRQQISLNSKKRSSNISDYSNGGTKRRR